MEQVRTPKLRFSTYNGKWDKVKLSKFVLGHKGGAPLTPSDFVESGDFEVIPKKAIVPNGKLKIDEHNRTYCSESFFNSYNKNTIDSSYLVTTLRDLVPSGPTIGYVVEFENEKKYLLAQGVYGFLLDESKLDRRFFIQFSNTIPYRRTMRRLMVGSTQVHIRNEDFFSINVPFPCYEEQQKISAFLSSVDKKISLLKEKHVLLCQYKKGVIQKLFKQEIRFKDESGSNFPDWITERVDYFVDRYSEPVEVEPNISYRQIGIRSHGKGIFHKENVQGHELGGKRVFWVHPNAFVVNIVFAWEHAVAKTSKDEKGFIASHRFPMYLPKDSRVDLRFFTLFFLSKRGKYLLELASPGGAGRNKTLGQSNFAELKVTFPCLEEQKRIADFNDALEEKLETVKKQIELTQAFKKGLLQQMFV